MDNSQRRRTLRRTLTGVGMVLQRQVWKLFCFYRLCGIQNRQMRSQPACLTFCPELFEIKSHAQQKQLCPHAPLTCCQKATKAIIILQQTKCAFYLDGPTRKTQETQGTVLCVGPGFCKLASRVRLAVYYFASSVLIRTCANFCTGSLGTHPKPRDRTLCELRVSRFHVITSFMKLRFLAYLSIPKCKNRQQTEL